MNLGLEGGPLSALKHQIGHLGLHGLQVADAGLVAAAGMKLDEEGRSPKMAPPSALIDSCPEIGRTAPLPDEDLSSGHPRNGRPF